MSVKISWPRRLTTIEIDVLKRLIGKQDHYAAAFGSINFSNSILMKKFLLSQWMKILKM